MPAQKSFFIDTFPDIGATPDVGSKSATWEIVRSTGHLDRGVCNLDARST